MLLKTSLCGCLLTKCLLSLSLSLRLSPLSSYVSVPIAYRQTHTPGCQSVLQQMPHQSPPCCSNDQGGDEDARGR